MPHIHEQYDFVITAVIVHNDKVLFVHHPRYDKWLFPGGHIELHEDPEQALYREITEETGLSVQLLEPKVAPSSDGVKGLPTPQYLDVHDANPPHKHIGLVYFCKAADDKSIKSAEHTDMRWLSEAELEDVSYELSPSLKLYATEALKSAAA